MSTRQGHDFHSPPTPPFPNMLNSFRSANLRTDLLTNIYTALYEIKLFRYKNDMENLTAERPNQKQQSKKKRTGNMVKELKRLNS